MSRGSAWAARQEPQKRRLPEWEDKRARRQAEFTALIPAIAAQVAAEVSAAVSAALQAARVEHHEGLNLAPTTTSMPSTAMATSPTTCSTICLGGNTSATATPASPTTVSTMLPSPAEIEDVHDAVDLGVGDLAASAPTTCSTVCLAGQTSMPSTLLSSAAVPASSACTPASPISVSAASMGPVVGDLLEGVDDLSSTSPSVCLSLCSSGGMSNFIHNLLVESDTGCSYTAPVPVPQVLDGITVTTSAGPNDATQQDDQGLLNKVVMLEKFKPVLSLEQHLLVLVVMRNAVVLWPVFQSARCSPVILLPWDPGASTYGMCTKFQVMLEQKWMVSLVEQLEIATFPAMPYNIHHNFPSGNLMQFGVLSLHNRIKRSQWLPPQSICIQRIVLLSVPWLSFRCNWVAAYPIILWKLPTGHPHEDPDGYARSFVLHWTSSSDENKMHRLPAAQTFWSKIFSSGETEDCLQYDHLQQWRPPDQTTEYLEWEIAWLLVWPSGAESDFVCRGLVTITIWLHFKLEVLPLLHYRNLSFWRYPSVEQIMPNSEHIFQCGFELTQWKFAWSFNLECFDVGNQTRQLISTATLTYHAWYFHWDPGIWALLCVFGFFAQAAAEGKILLAGREEDGFLWCRRTVVVATSTIQSRVLLRPSTHRLDYYLGAFQEQVHVIFYLNLAKVCLDYNTHCNLGELVKHQAPWDPGGSAWHRLEVKPKIKEGGMLATLPSVNMDWAVGCLPWAWLIGSHRRQQLHIRGNGLRSSWLGTGRLRPPQLLSSPSSQVPLLLPL